jgi:hypothetical protein
MWRLLFLPFRRLVNVVRDRLTGSLQVWQHLEPNMKRHATPTIARQCHHSDNPIK